MGFVRKDDQLGSYEVHEGILTGAELLKLTFNNGDVLFLSEKGRVAVGITGWCYKVHPDFMPLQLESAARELGRGQENDAWVAEAIAGYTVDIVIGNGSVALHGADLETVSDLISIEICAYGDAYRSDLHLQPAMEH